MLYFWLNKIKPLIFSVVSLCLNRPDQRINILRPVY